MNRLQVHIASKRFGQAAPTLQDLRLQAQPGELLALVGPSGAGKTSLLKIISGLDPDYQGQVQLGTNCRISMVFQEPRLMPWLTVAENLHLVAPGLAPAQLQQALDRVGLGDCARRFARQLSGGMQRRVALLRAFLTQPGLLLLDEPFASLDRPTAELLRQQLLDLWQEHKPTVLLVTHSLTEALALADRVLFLGTHPARVVLDHAVQGTRPRALDSQAVQAMAQALLQAHPDLLRGQAQTEPAPPP